MAIAATFLQIGWSWFRHRKVENMMWISLAIISVFGGMTLLLHDETFIKWKPTVLYGAMALALAVALWGMRKNVLQLMLGTQLILPQPVWHRLTIAWIGYCLFMATINAYVAVYFSTEQWVNFKLWGYVFPILFVIGQGLYIARHWKDKEPS